MGQIITTADAVATLRRLDHTDVYNVERVAAFIERQAETIRTMAAVLTKPSPGIDDASAAAAEIVARTASQNMVAVLTCLAMRGPMIAENVAVVTRIPSANRRVSDACNAGWVTKTGHAKNAKGRTANVYSITDLGHEMLRLNQGT